MTKNLIAMKRIFNVSIACCALALAGCSSQAKEKSASDVEAFQGNPNSPAAQAAAQRGIAEDAQKAAAARAAAQGKTAPAPPK